jgi:uncharacterized membrane protein YdbT with pleckstrin-like domain
MIFEKIQLEADEEIVSMVRRHWFFLCMQGVPLLFLAILPPLCGFFIAILFPELYAHVPSSATPFVLFFYALWILVIWMILTTIWTDYYLDIWCITNKRIIKIDQVGLFRRKTGSFRLERMQDVNVEIDGLIATLLDYGTVHVQTASADMEEFKATFLPKPQEIKSTILRAGDVLMERATVDQNV